MQRANSKQELIGQLRQERSEWKRLVEEVGAHRLELPGVTEQWTMKDTIAHLTTWWRREVARLAAAQRDERPPDHPPHSEVAVINAWIYLTNRDRSIEQVLRDAEETWQDFESRIQALSEENLFTPGRFAWMGDQALGPGILQDFVNHFHEEHQPLIRAWLAKIRSS